MNAQEKNDKMCVRKNIFRGFEGKKGRGWGIRVVYICLESRWDIPMSETFTHFKSTHTR